MPVRVAEGALLAYNPANPAIYRVKAVGDRRGYYSIVAYRPEWSQERADRADPIDSIPVPGTLEPIDDQRGAHAHRIP